MRTPPPQLADGGSGIPPPAVGSLVAGARSSKERSYPAPDEGIVDGWIETAAGGSPGFEGSLGELEQLCSDRRLPGRIELRELRIGQEARERGLEARELGLGVGEGALGDRIAGPLEQTLDVGAHGAEGVPQHGQDVLVEATGGSVTMRTAGGVTTAALSDDRASCHGGRGARRGQLTGVLGPRRGVGVIATGERPAIGGEAPLDDQVDAPRLCAQVTLSRDEASRLRGVHG